MNTSYRQHMQRAVDIQQQALDQNREMTAEEQERQGVRKPLHRGDRAP